MRYLIRVDILDELDDFLLCSFFLSLLFEKRLAFCDLFNVLYQHVGYGEEFFFFYEFRTRFGAYKSGD